MLRRTTIFAYGVFSYAVGMAAIVYIVGFLGNFGVPRGIDGAATVATLPALAIDLGLILLFGLQHSVMARPAFKRRWTRIVPEAAERSTYVLASALALFALFFFWQPLGGLVWEIRFDAGRTAVNSLFVFGWVLLVFSTFQIDHFELFGLKQSSAPLFGRIAVPPAFKMPVLYRHVRHPIYVGWLLGMWAAPTMTASHLVFALATTIYILTAIRFEERDLLAAHGSSYAAYRDAVPMLVPRLRGGNIAPAALTTTGNES